MAWRPPSLPYRAERPKSYNPPIGMIGCGAITRDHLRAYRRLGLNLVAFCDIDPQRAAERRDEFYPEARVYESYRDLLRRDEIEVVDIATHPRERGTLLKAAIQSGKHILSQKPFVLDLDLGEELAELADRHGVQLAINQNGRWAPHFSYLRLAVADGLIGDVRGAHLEAHWSHAWTKGTPFEKIKHLLLYDFGIHWFDIIRVFLAGRKPLRVYASTARTRTQEIQPALLAQALVEFDSAQATVAFDGDVPIGRHETTFLSGDRGTLRSEGPSNNQQKVTLVTADGEGSPALVGSWFPDGFGGTMAELLHAIAENRPSAINAWDNLESLALCFAAIASSLRHQPVVPGQVRQLPK